MKKAAIWIAAAGIALALTGCGQKCKVADVPDTVAVVDGQNIPASQYFDQTSRRAGREVLANLIEQNIIIKWAKDEGVPPTQDQINRQIKTLERDGMYDRQVKLMGKEAVTSELTAMQARINLVKKIIKIDDKELESVYNMMKSRYVHGPRKYVALIINSDKKKVEDAAKAIEKGMSFEDAASKFSDKRFSMGGGPIEIWIAEGQEGLPQELANAAKETKVNGISKVFSFGQEGMPTNYVLMKVTKAQPKADLKLKDVKEEVEDAAAMQKSQMDPKFTEELSKRKRDSKITISIPYLKDVAETVKNPPETNPMMGGNVKPGPAPKAKQ
ncbi:MAG: peptidyl-prolyl cis-trans isomerase [Armatimonadota bacterium]|nr:peptidyl-prolyl cis-trans isomerase [bacterium]